MEYSYLDRSTETLKGETWKLVLNYEEGYEISDFGRIRSIDRRVPHPRLGSQFVKGRILKQKINTNINIVTGDPSIYLSVALSNEGNLKYFNIRRLVYSTFVYPISFDDDSLVVLNIDGDGYNNHLHNLTVATYQEKSIRAYKRKRVPESYLKTADRSKWTKIHGGTTRRKPICQYDTKGNFISEYVSITEASRITGVGEKEIINVAKNKYKQWNGFVWRYK